MGHAIGFAGSHTVLVRTQSTVGRLYHIEECHGGSVGIRRVTPGHVTVIDRQTTYIKGMLDIGIR
jgi:hypothetical protein